MCVCLYNEREKETFDLRQKGKQKWKNKYLKLSHN